MGTSLRDTAKYLTLVASATLGACTHPNISDEANFFRGGTHVIPDGFVLGEGVLDAARPVEFLHKGYRVKIFHEGPSTSFEVKNRDGDLLWRVEYSDGLYGFEPVETTYRTQDMEEFLGVLRAFVKSD